MLDMNLNKLLAYLNLVLSANRQNPLSDYVVFMFYKSVGTETLAVSKPQDPLLHHQHLHTG